MRSSHNGCVDVGHENLSQVHFSCMRNEAVRDGIRKWGKISDVASPKFGGRLVIDGDLISFFLAFDRRLVEKDVQISAIFQQQYWAHTRCPRAIEQFAL